MRRVTENVNGNAYAYALDVVREDGASAGQVPIEVDWEPAYECTRFLAVRQGLPLAEAFERPCQVEPLWHQERGEPYLGGFRIRLARDGTGELEQDFSTSYFRALARRASAQLVAQGALVEGERFRCLPLAFPHNDNARATARTVGLVARPTAPPLVMCESSIDAFQMRAVCHGDVDTGDMPVFLAGHILEEAAHLTGEAGAAETGGILIGHLHHDTPAPEAFAEVTAQIPARHTEADLTKLTFTADTWTAVRDALALRGRSEIMLGWWHSHPVREWCKECPPERQKGCALARDFLSEHDRALHRTVFPRAYSVALVVNDVAADGPTFSLFGWRLGLLEPRGFYTLGARSPSMPADSIYDERTVRAHAYGARGEHRHAP